MKLPVVLADGQIRVSQHGSDVVIQTEFGLRVAYDLKYYVRVTVPGSYYQQLCGLCGDYNGDPKDDFQKPDGSQASNPNDFGNSWEEKVPGSPCLPPPPTTCQPGGDCGVCTPEQQQHFQQDGFCGFLTKPHGPLAACHALVDPQGPLQDCVFDMCVANGNQSILCSIIHAYVSACQAAGGQVKPWRNESFCREWGPEEKGNGGGACPSLRAGQVGETGGQGHTEGAQPGPCSCPVARGPTWPFCSLGSHEMSPQQPL